MMPRSKQYAVKYQWFWEGLGPRNVALIKIDMKDQLGDLFTKGLDEITFEKLQKQIMGWWPPFRPFEREYRRYPTSYPTILPTIYPTMHQ